MSKRLATALFLVGLGWLAAACGQTGSPADDPVAAAADASLRGGAVAEATAIAQYIQSTAAVEQAVALATAMAGDEGQTVTAGVAPAATLLPPQQTVEPVPTRDPPARQVLSVGLAADGDLIVVSLVVPPDEAETWGAGEVSVVDEASGAVYGQVPLMPGVGPLIGRPRLEGQMGYIVLANSPPGLQPGALVTVVLGNRRFEHIRAQ
jgi:hypothetical protein